MSPSDGPQPKVVSSKERILGERHKEATRLRFWIQVVLVCVTALVFAILSGAPDDLQPKLLGTVGLVLDISGASLVALTLFRPYRDPVAEGKQFLSYYEPYRSLKVVEHQERLTLPMQVGAAVLVFGFALQIAALWV